MIKLGKKMERKEIEYKLEGIDFNEGIDVYQLIPYLVEFGDLIKETVRELGYEEEVSVRVRPFKQGSFITEFVVTYGNDLTNLFSSREATALASALTILGFMKVKDTCLPKIIKAVKGRISEYKETDDGYFIYEGSNGQQIKVDGNTQKVIQSKKIASHYKNISTGPIIGSNNTVTNVVIAPPNEKNESDKISFSADDIEYFDLYQKNVSGEEEEDLDNTEVIQHGIYLNPISGSYSGKEKGYKFKSGDKITYGGVIILDKDLIDKLESSEIRFFEKDLLKVDLKTTQTVSKNGTIKEHYAIVKMHDYIPYNPPKQYSIDDYQ